MRTTASSSEPPEAAALMPRPPSTNSITPNRLAAIIIARRFLLRGFLPCAGSGDGAGIDAVVGGTLLIMRGRGPACWVARLSKGSGASTLA